MENLGFRQYFLAFLGLTVFVLIGPIGSVAATLAQFLVLLSIPVLFNLNWLNVLAKEPVLLAFLFGFLVLAASFSIVEENVAAALHVLNFFALFLALPLYLWLRNIPAEIVRNFLAIAAFLGVAACLLVAVYQTQIVGLDRAEGWASNSNIIARVALILGFMSLIGLKLFKQPWRYMFIVAPVMAIIVVFLSGSRGAYLGIPILVGISVHFAVLSGRAMNMRKLAWVAALLLLFVSLVSLFSTSRFSQIWSQIMNVLDGQSAGDSIDTRIAMYKAGWAAFKQQPIFGYGWEKMMPTVAAFDAASGSSFELENYRHLHSDFFNFAVGAGIAGITAWLSFLGAPIWYAGSHLKHIENSIPQFMLLMLPMTFLVFGLTDMTIGYDVLTVLYAFAIAAALACVKRNYI